MHMTGNDIEIAVEPRIAVVGVGGAGCNVVSAFSDSLCAVDTIAINTDKDALHKTDADTIVCEVNPDYLNEIEKIYLNGEFVWDTRTVSPIYKVAGEPEVIIVK